MKREEAKRELKDKLKYVENELQHLTEKIISSGLMEESRKSRKPPIRQEKNSHGATRKITEEKWKILPADAVIPTAVYELSAIGLPQTYLAGSYSRPMPQFSYNSYPLSVLPQSNCNKHATRYVTDAQHRPAVSRVATLHRRLPKNTKRGGHRMPVTATSKIVPEYRQVNGNIGGATVPASVLTESYRPTTDEISKHGEQPPKQNSTVRCYISDGNSSNVRRSFTNCGTNFTGRSTNADDLTSKHLHINRNMPDGAHYQSSREDFTPCDKCQGFNKQRLVVQQREVYNEFARARDQAAISKAYAPHLCHRDYAVNNIDRSPNAIIIDPSRDGMSFVDDKAIREDVKEATCNCERHMKSTTTMSPLDSRYAKQ